METLQKQFEVGMNLLDGEKPLNQKEIEKMQVIKHFENLKNNENSDLKEV